jgi:hypothetical protein
MEREIGGHRETARMSELPPTILTVTMIRNLLQATAASSTLDRTAKRSVHAPGARLTVPSPTTTR